MAAMTRYLFLFVVLIGLAGCGPMYETTYTYVAPSGAAGKRCVQQCTQSKQLCKRICHKDENACMIRAKKDARGQFRNYKERQQREGLPIEKNLNDFLDNDQCQRRDCGCEGDYRACFQMCGGELVPHRKCVAFCDKQ